MEVDPGEKIMLSRSVELSDANSPQAPTWRASYRCFTTDSLPRGYSGSMFGLQRMQNSTVSSRDSRFILVRTLDRDRVIALCPVGVSLCVGLIVSVVSRNPALLYIVRRPES